MMLPTFTSEEEEQEKDTIHLYNLREGQHPIILIISQLCLYTLNKLFSDIEKSYNLHF